MNRIRFHAVQHSKLFILLSVAGPTYGIGHEVRMQNFSKMAKHNGWQVQHHKLKEGYPLELNFPLIQSKYKSICAVIDLDPRYVQSCQQELIKTLKKFKMLNSKVFFIESDLRNINTMQFYKYVDHVFYPYGHIGTKKGKKLSTGLGYSIFSPELVSLAKKKESGFRGSHYVLISCGGSDPAQVTEFYMNQLVQFHLATLNVTVICGPHFDSERRKALKYLVSGSQHKFLIKRNVKNVYKLYEDSTVALVTGGLSRNEIAFLQKQSFVVDLNAEQAKTTKLLENYSPITRVGRLDRDTKALMSEKFNSNFGRFILENSKGGTLTSKDRVFFVNGSEKNLLVRIEELV